MRIGIDFDNTIICYDNVFCNLAKAWGFIGNDFSGNKKALRDHIRTLQDGELKWQRLQGKAYGEFIAEAYVFEGFKAFLSACQQRPDIQLFVVSHKTEFGHHDEKRVSLREAAKTWMRQQRLTHEDEALLQPEHVFFETTREDKISRIKVLQCTHFIDDLVEVFEAPEFPLETQKLLFQPLAETDHKVTTLPSYSDWNTITHALFS